MRAQSRKQFPYLPARPPVDKTRRRTVILSVLQVHLTVLFSHTFCYGIHQSPYFTKLMALWEDHKVHNSLVQQSSRRGEQLSLQLP